jgi:superoxide dismutase, Cu-Zn family
MNRVSVAIALGLVVAASGCEDEATKDSSAATDAGARTSTTSPRADSGPGTRTPIPLTTDAGTGMMGGDAGAALGADAGATRGAPAEVRLAGVGATVEGTARLVEADGGVRVTVEVTKAPPGKHGIHFHEKGDCSDPKAKSMGAHLSPEGHKHGLPTADAGAPRHLGDLGNIEIGKDGTGRLEMTVANANLRAGDKMSFVDRALIIHAKVDDGTDPAGNSGDPIACGVVTVGGAGATSTLGADAGASALGTDAGAGRDAGAAAKDGGTGTGAGRDGGR